MMKRMLTAACAALVFDAALVAQTPVETLKAPAALEAPAMPPAACAGCDAPRERRGDRFWVNGEYLFAWIQGYRLPPLVTTSPAGTAQASAGVIGLPTTSTLLGGNLANNDLRSGFRLETGFWFSPEQRLGIEGGATIIESQSTLFNATSTGEPILARPYFDVTTSSSQAVLVAFPGVSSGTIDVRSSSGNFYGANFAFTENFLDIGWLRLNSLIGYRFYRYDEGLRFRQALSPAGGAFVPGTVIASADDFTAQNEYHGGDLGFRAQFFFWETMSLGFMGKFGVGKVHNTVKISGSQTTSVPGAAPVTVPGGVLALSSNIGTFGQNRFAMLPELGVNLGWQVRPHLRLSLGYSLWFLNDIARAPSQIDFNINPNLFPPPIAGGPLQPAPTLTQSNIWIQSINFGAMVSF